MLSITDKRTMDVLFRLGFIASVKAGERFDTVSYTICGDNILDRCWRAAFSRTESRATTIVFIQKALVDGITMLTDTKTPPDLFPIILRALDETISGLENLKVTYASDRMQVSKLNTLVNMLKMETTKIVQNRRSGIGLEPCETDMEKDQPTEQETSELSL